jgi:hypothetical protein
LPDELGTRARELVLIEQDGPLLRAFLVAQAPLLRKKLEPSHAELLDEHFLFLDPMLAAKASQRLQEVSTDDLGEYGPAYQSPRERELEAILDDPRRTRQEKLDAAQQIARIIDKRLKDAASKEQGTRIEGSVEWTPIPPGSYRSWLRCKKHGIEHCSECRPDGRGKRRRKSTGSLEGRFASLAREAGYEPSALRTPPKSGRPSPEESRRLRALATIARTLNEDDNYSLEAIGRVIGRPSRQSVADLIKRLAA